jgi:hypothetical protein
MVLTRQRHVADELIVGGYTAPPCSSSRRVQRHDAVHVRPLTPSTHGQCQRIVDKGATAAHHVGARSEATPSLLRRLADSGILASNFWNRSLENASAMNSLAFLKP